MTLVTFSITKRRLRKHILALHLLILIGKDYQNYVYYTDRSQFRFQKPILDTSGAHCLACRSELLIFWETFCRNQINCWIRLALDLSV